MNSKAKMSSIARKINLDFWFKRFWDVIGVDILLVALVCCGAFIWCEEKLPDTERVISRDIIVTDSDDEVIFNMDSEGGALIDSVEHNKKEGEKGVLLKDVKYYIVTDKGNYAYSGAILFDIVYRPFLVLFVFQGIHLFFALFGAGSIRRRMKPLNELAKKAEEISRIPLDNSAKFENLEHAISNISPDEENMRVRTGDKELESIEIALNNLLYRMKESQKQQARFVSDASHELRTPISVVQGYVNMLDRWGKEDPAILDEAIEALKHESDHMKELIEQLLFLARGDSGRNTINKTDIDMNELMKEVWEESEMIDDKHTYVFDEFKGGFGAYMTGDVAMVKQSVRIFVQNAAKYSNEGDTIKLGVKVADDTVSYIVQDEGIGMQEEDVSHIFERFYRSDKARNGETGGSGLGLSIAKWIIDAHEGRIEVLSRPDIGTRFTVTFPKTMNIIGEEEQS